MKEPRLDSVDAQVQPSQPEVKTSREGRKKTGLLMTVTGAGALALVSCETFKGLGTDIGMGMEATGKALKEASAKGFSSRNNLSDVHSSNLPGKPREGHYYDALKVTPDMFRAFNKHTQKWEPIIPVYATKKSCPAPDWFEDPEGNRVPTESLHVLVGPGKLVHVSKLQKY